MASEAGFKTAIELLEAAVGQPYLPQMRRVIDRMTVSVDDETLNAAAALWVAQNHTLPFADQLLAMVSEIRYSISQLSSAEEAWDEVAEAIRLVGGRRTPTFSNPAIGRAVKATGGWEHICASTTLAAERKTFLAAYNTLMQRMIRVATLPPRLQGQIRRNNDLALPTPDSTGVSEQIGAAIAAPTGATHVRTQTRSIEPGPVSNRQPRIGA